MSEKYQELQCIRDKCVNAKKEFCVVVHRRLQDVLYVSKQSCQINYYQDMLHQQYEKLRKYIKFFQQLHDAPLTYFTLIGEILRRKHVSTSFLEWANATSKTSLEFLEKEIAHRKAIQQKLSSHFLFSFAFMDKNDMPPEFAKDPPKSFDDQLPQIPLDEIKELKELFPEYSSLLDVPLEVPSISPRLVSPLEEINVECPKRPDTENDDFEKVTSAPENTSKSEAPTLLDVGCDPAFIVSTNETETNTDILETVDVAIEALLLFDDKFPTKISQDLPTEPSERAVESPIEPLTETKQEVQSGETDVTSTSNQKSPSDTSSTDPDKISILT